MPDIRTRLSLSETGIARATAAIVLTATLTGCAASGGHQTTMRAEPTFMRLTEERVFAQALRQRYLELATNAYDRSDFDRSDFYSLRAIMAVEGKLVDPAGAAGEVSGPLATARMRLVNSLSSGARTGSPDLAARAQAAFDCWWLETQPDGDSAIASACAYNTDLTLAELSAVGTGNRLAALRNGSQQVVINGTTPSQTFTAEGATIEVINERPVAAPAHSQQSQHLESFAPAPMPMAEEELAYTPAPLVQQSAALARSVQGVEPMESVSARTFVIEPPASFAGQADTVIDTVPISDGTAPIDLIPDYEAFFQEAPSYGGQYVALEPSQTAQPEPSFTEAPVRGDDVPMIDAPVIDTPVFNDADAEPFALAPVMMDQSDGVLSSLVNARSLGSSDFAVYFGFDSAEITPEGEDVLGDTIEALTLENRNTVSLMGFTDSAGDSRYNQLLAMRRANAVRQFIQQRTDAPVQFEIMPVGEAEAVQNGGDGVTEALNRRVEIVLQ